MLWGVAVWASLRSWRMNEDRPERGRSKPGRANSKCTGPEGEVGSERLERRTETGAVQQSESRAEQRVGDEGRATFNGTIFTIFLLSIK